MSIMITKWDIIFLGVDAGLTYLFYRLHSHATKEATVIQSMPVYQPGVELAKELMENEKILDYACVEGSTAEVSGVLKSQHIDGQTGLIQILSFIEHKSKRSQGYWSDVANVIRNETNTRPFKLTDFSGSTEHMVEVQDPLLADHIKESLTTTFDHYEPVNYNLLQRGLDRLFGEVTKGHQEKEEMLGLGVRLLGIGKVSLEGSKMILSPPEEGMGRYILTTLSKNELITQIKSKAKVFKVLCWICGLVGIGFVSYWMYKNLRTILEDLQMRRALADVRRLRNQANAADAEGNNNGDENENRDPCVVCMVQPRELIVLDCGHLCLCGDCGRLLPAPRRCPICRREVNRLLPVYNS